jgi:hypothetical protein
LQKKTPIGLTDTLVRLFRPPFPMGVEICWSRSTWAGGQGTASSRTTPGPPRTPLRRGQCAYRLGRPGRHRPAHRGCNRRLAWSTLGGSVVP